MERTKIDIERLVHWALATEAAEAGGAGAGEAGWLAASGSTAASVATFGALGVLIDGGRHKSIGGTRTHSDALEVAHAISTLPELSRDLVRRYGRTGSRPDFGADLRPTMGPVLDHDDRPKVSPAWDHNRNPLPRYCPIAWSISPAEVNSLRFRYDAWRAGLCTLAGHFRSRPDRLVRWRVTGPAVLDRPADPWLFHAPPARQVIPDQAFPDLAARLRRPIHASNRPMEPVEAAD